MTHSVITAKPFRRTDECLSLALQTLFRTFFALDPQRTFSDEIFQKLLLIFSRNFRTFRHLAFFTSFAIFPVQKIWAPCLDTLNNGAK